MNRDELKEFFRTLHRSTAVEQNKSAMITEGQHSGRPEFDGTFDVEEEELYDIDNYDVEELASYHALNGDVDATLYRDNPDYRNAFIDMIVMKFGEERMQQFDHQERDKESLRLSMERVPEDEDTEDDDLVMGQVPYSEDYQSMIDDIESRRGRPYDID